MSDIKNIKRRQELGVDVSNFKQIKYQMRQE